MSPWITVVVVCYQRYLHLPIIVHSFLTQTNAHWHLLILHDGPDKEHAKIVQPYVDAYPNIEYHQSKTRYNDYGHSLRQWAIDEFVDTPWVLQTNDDNYYVPTFLAECHDSVTQSPSPDLVLYDCLLNTLATNCQTLGPYSSQYSFPKMGLIDMGSFILKTSLANQTQFKTELFTADGVYIQTLLETFRDLSIIKLNQTLCVHN